MEHAQVHEFGGRSDQQVGDARCAVLSTFSEKPLHLDRAVFRRGSEAAGLAGREVETAAHLSGGEKQRLAVARAIYKDAAVVFVDEPTASLDAANRSHVVGLFNDLAEQGCTVVVATHDDEMMGACSHRYVVGR